MALICDQFASLHVELTPLQLAHDGFFVTMPFDELILHFSFPFLAVSGFGFLLKPSAYSVLNNKQAAHIFWPAKGRQGWGKKAHPRANSDSVADDGGGEAHGRRTPAPPYGAATQGRTEKEALSALGGLCFTRARPKGVPVRLQRGTFVEDM